MAIANPEAGISEVSFDLLNDHNYMNLTTYRKNGTEVTRPVWFAKEDGALYFVSVEGSGKVKHIRNDANVFVSPSDARGNPLSEERIAGTARIYAKGESTAAKANRALNQKYGIQKALFSLMFFFRRSTVVWGEILPVTEHE